MELNEIDMSKLSIAELMVVGQKITETVLLRNHESHNLLKHFNNKLEDIQHTMETTPMDVFTGYRLAKETQDVRRLRRVLKRDIALYSKMTKDWSIDIGAINKQFKRVTGSSWCEEENLIQQKTYSNVEKLGEVTFADAEASYLNTLPSVEEGVELLKEKLG